MGFEEEKKLDERFLMQTFSRKPVLLVEGSGMEVTDDTGKKYLDFIAGIGVNSLGHCHPAVSEAIAEQAIEHQTGARGLRSICEAALMDVMYELPDHEGRTKVVIKRSDIEGSTKPEIIQVEVEPSKKRKKPAKENVE